MYIIFLKFSKRKKYNIKNVFFLLVIFEDIIYYIQTIVYIFFDDTDTIVWYNNKMKTFLSDMEKLGKT